MVDGVITGKEQAQVAFENAVRSTIPGKIAIVEHVAGNIFRSRIFPISKTGRTVKIAWTQDTRNNRYDLPLSFPDKVGNLDVYISLVLPLHVTEIPKLVNTDLINNDKNAQFIKVIEDGTKNCYIASTVQRSVTLNKGFTINVPSANQDYIIEKSEDGKASFLINSFPKASQVGPNLQSVTKIGILWDASRSRAGKTKEVELKFSQNITNVA